MDIPLVSQRGVVFFRNQELNSDQQKQLAQKLGELTGKPSTSKAGNTLLFVGEGGLHDCRLMSNSSTVML